MPQPKLIQEVNRVDPPSASVLLADSGFLSRPDLPEPGPPTFVGLRAAPTLRHFEPHPGRAAPHVASVPGRLDRRRDLLAAAGLIGSPTR